MKEYFIALLLSALPAVGSIIGGWLAEPIPPSNRNLSLALHLAAGIALAVIGVELMPQILDADPPWIVILSFVLGGGFFVLTRQLIHWGQRLSSPKSQGEATPLLIYFGVAVDIFSDGLMVGTGTTISFGLGLLLALGQVMANIPGGLVTLATFKSQRVKKRYRQWISASFCIPAFLGTTIGYWTVRGQPDIVKYSLLAFTAGILITVVVENMVPEAAEKEKETYLETLMFIGGFALFNLLSVYFG
ncbi:zinc/iron permease [Gloeothece citriformis PCC 7424]|uniref:Zinc/iron permease n=1 Tax=Gloeothece citriformis (strain PCC 7424) TaxID=65393 RepID=B7K7I6_GLOC7|nr:ZIP family metal transporter [Gloeothece citriformis]ACK69754.1 zinc/iron permease [Gloeothece citriformis PCC 7424]